MRIGQLASLDSDSVLRPDITIVGGGPVGLTIAERCAGLGMSVLVLESGLETEDEPHEALNAVELVGDGSLDGCVEQRQAFHAPLAKLWSAERQGYGVRCRGLGGSTQAWAGKSAPFDPIDYRKREWVRNSGWPITPEDLAPYIATAGELLNLSPKEPPPRFTGDGLVSFYWQFARSRVDHFDVMRFGREFMARRPRGVDILLDATVTRISLEHDRGRVAHLDVADSSGQIRRVAARHFVLAASAIENARLLLISNDVAAAGIGNEHDNVGRFMVDHTGTRIGSFHQADVHRMAKVFGFYGVPHRGRSHMFMHGLALDPRLQETEGLLNGSLWFSPLRSADDPWDSLKRLIKGRSQNRLQDLASVARGSGTLGKGMATKIVTSPRFPNVLKSAVVNSAIRLSPNLVAEEFGSGGLPHKLCGLTIEAVTEQEPCRENRISLGTQRDRFGAPLPRACWRVGDVERRTLMALAGQIEGLFTKAGLPQPILEDWVQRCRPDEARPIDLAHTMGTTRMSSNPKCGVVDPHCRIHGIANLHIAGGSVFPTGGHANPTLMMLALACRLSDRLKQTFD